MRERGQEFEQLTASLLERHGLELLARNYRCRAGEIDLIMRDGETLVFVEVRARSHAGYGGAAATVTQAKQRRLWAAASHFLQRQPQLQRCSCRFDVVAWEPRKSAPAMEPRWIRSAFIT